MIANQPWKLQMLSCSLLFSSISSKSPVIIYNRVPDDFQTEVAREDGLLWGGINLCCRSQGFCGCHQTTRLFRDKNRAEGEIDISASWGRCTQARERARTILINALRSRGNSKREGRKGSRLRNAFLQSAMDLLERTNVTREAENILHKPFLLSIHRGSVSVSGSSRQLGFFPDCLLLWQDREGLSLKAH